jgi:hypothetical protein
LLIREATTQDFSQIAALIVAQSSRAQRRCIHSDPRGGVEQALREQAGFRLLYSGVHRRKER